MNHWSHEAEDRSLHRFTRLSFSASSGKADNDGAVYSRPFTHGWIYAWLSGGQRHHRMRRSTALSKISKLKCEILGCTCSEALEMLEGYVAMPCFATGWHGHSAAATARVENR